MHAHQHQRTKWIFYYRIMLCRRKYVNMYRCRVAISPCTNHWISGRTHVQRSMRNAEHRWNRHVGFIVIILDFRFRCLTFRVISSPVSNCTQLCLCLSAFSFGSAAIRYTEQVHRLVFWLFNICARLQSSSNCSEMVVKFFCFYCSLFLDTFLRVNE